MRRKCIRVAKQLETKSRDVVVACCVKDHERKIVVLFIFIHFNNLLLSIMQR